MHKAKFIIIVIFVTILTIAAVFIFFVINAEPTVAAYAIRIADGRVELTLQVRAPRKTIEAVRIDNLGGVTSLWRSDGQESAMPLTVKHGDKELSSGTSPMVFKPGITEALLSLFFEDNGAFSGKSTDFRVTVFFSDGGRVLCELSAEQSAQPFTPAITVETASERRTIMDFIVGILVGMVIFIIILIVLAKLELLAFAKKKLAGGGKEILISDITSVSKKRIRDFINKRKNGEKAKNSVGQEEDEARQAEEKRKARAKKLEIEKKARALKINNQKRTGEAKINEFFELCKNGTWQEITAAVENGTNLNMKNSEGLSAGMIIAGKNQNPEVIASLIEHIDDKGLSRLMWAAGRNPNPEVLSVFIDAGADVNAMVEGSTPLMQAASMNSNLEAVKLLLEAGADGNEMGDDGLTPLMLAAANNPNPDVLRALLESGGDINARNDEECSLLMRAAKSNPSPEMIQFLIESGADLDEEFEGLTPLMVAVTDNPNPEVIMALIRDKRERQIALIQAKKKKRQDVVEALIDD